MTFKKVRVFISSTFKDMHAERDHLVRVVFPDLKKLCREKRIELTDVDLRWGVSEQDAQDGKALDICLNEIDTCRPFFLGLLGHRYGWTPSGEDRSITAAEIYHGVLHNDLPEQVVDLRSIIEGRLEGKRLSNEQINCLRQWYPYDGEKRKYVLKAGLPESGAEIIRGVFREYAAYQRNRSFFFFRSERLSRELADTKSQDFFEEEQAEQDKLEALKQEIKDQKLWWTDYDHIESRDDNDLEAFGRKVKDVLWKRIEDDLGKEPEEERDWLDEEREFHDLFVADRTRHFVGEFGGRTNELKAMHTFCEGDSDSPLLLVCGEPGSGKSALLARFSEQIKSAQPDWLIIPHFVGASPGSTNLRRTLLRIFGEINRHLGLDEEIPQDVRDLVSLLPQKLDQAAQAGPVLIIMDAVNQFERADDAQDMRWLPSNLPGNLRLVISTLDGPAREALVARRPESLEVKGLDADAIKKLVDKYLKDLKGDFPNPSHKAAFLEKLSAGSPLYIMVALEELRVFGDFDAVLQRIKDLPGSVRELFNQVLDRVEADFSRFPGLVQDALCLIACGRQGMAPQELQTLLAHRAPPRKDGSPADKLPDMLMARLRVSLDAYLFERSGVLDFFHGQLKEAVGERWLADDKSRIDIHSTIADYFKERWAEPYIRALDELPHHQIKSQDWDGLAATLCDLRFLQAKCEAGLIYELLADYQAALASLPENQAAIQLENERQARLDKYAKDLVAYAKGEIKELDIPPSVTPKSDEELEAERQRIINNPTRLDRVKVFGQYMNSESHHFLALGAAPSFFYSHAYNYADSGPVAQAAEEIITRDSFEALLLRYPAYRPPFNPHLANLSTLEGHRGWILTVALTGDGRLAVSGGYNSALRVWDLETGRCQHILQGDSGFFNAVALANDGHFAVSGDNEGTLRVWDIKTGNCLSTLEGKSGSVLSVALTGDDRLAVSGGYDSTLRIFELETGRCLRILQGHSGPVRKVALTHDGRLAVSGSEDSTLRVWDIGSGRCLRTLQGHSGPVCSVALTGDGRFAVSGSEDKTLRVWDMDSGRCLRTLGGHSNIVHTVTIAHDGRLAVSGSEDKTLRVWDMDSGRCLRTLQGHSGSVCSVALTGDGRLAVSGGHDKTLRAWDLEMGRCLPTREGHSGSVRTLAFAHDGRLAVSGSEDSTLRVWDSAAGLCLRAMEGHSGSVFAVALSGDGRRFVSGSWDKTLRIWDLETGHCLRTLHGHTGGVFTVAIAGDGRQAISGGFDRALRVWDLETGRCLRTLEGYNGGVFSVALTSDGRQAISGGFDRALQVWDLETGRCLRTLEGHREEVYTVALTGDGSRAISGGFGKVLRVWDIETGHCLRTLHGHTDKIFSVALTSDGRVAISGSSDNTLRAWDLDSGRCLVFERVDYTVYSLALDGNDMVAGLENGRLEALRLVGKPSDSNTKPNRR